MAWQNLPYIIPMMVATIVTILVACYAWKKRDMPGGIYFFLLMLMVSEYAFANVGEFASLHVNTKTLWTKISYLGSVNVAPLWLAFALGYSQRAAWLTWRRAALLWVIPIWVIGMVATNDWHKWVWPMVTPTSSRPGDMLVYSHGIIVWIIVFYSYLLLLAGAYLILRFAFRSPRPYRQQAWTLIAGLSIPGIGNILYFSELNPLPGLDITPIAFSLTGLIIAWSVFRFHTFDLIPVAREAVLENLRDGIFVLDTHDRIVDANPAAYRICRYNTKDAIGQPIIKVLTEWNRILISCGNSTEAQTEIEIGERWVDLRISPLYNRHRQPSGRLVVLRDIATRKRVELTLQQYTHDLEAQNAELDAFAHTVAHDLKNPLSAILGFGSLLEYYFDRMDTDQIQETLHSINQTGNKMTSIINELLLLASVRKMQQVEIGPLDMERIILEAQRRLVDIITEYRAKIRSPETWPAAIGYGPWVEEVWANYISNALKYGGKPPAIELGFDKQNLSPDQHAGMIDNQPAQNDSSTGKEYIRFWVRDNGNGLTPKEQSKLFVEFTRLEQARAQGHGLGLSIVRRIVEKLGGQVGVESQPGAGSKFYFTLPKADEEIEPTPETIIDPDETL